MARDQLYLYHMLNGPQSTKPPWNSAERNLVNTPVPQSRGELLLVDGDQNCFMLLCELCLWGEANERFVLGAVAVGHLGHS